MKFKESSLLKKHKQLLGNKRDKRKKVVKSTSPTPDLKKAVIKKQEGGTLFSIYNSIDPYIPPAIDFNAPELETEIVTNPIKKRQAKVIEEAKKSTTNSEAQELKEINSEVPSKKIPKSSETWKSPYSNKNEWVSDLTNAYKKAGITNDNAIRMLISQDALESGWGRSAQGKFNFGNLTTGSSWKGAYVEGKDHDAKGNPIKQRFRAYDSMDEYAADKIQFLKRLYDFDENDDINRFTAKLTGANKGKRRYAEAKNYATSLINVYNKYEEGGKMQKSEELLVKKALEFGQKTSEKMSPYDVRLIDFIKSKEGFRPKPEKDKTDGKWTVGYGLTDPKLIRKYRNGITEEEASKHLIQHLQMGADSLATMPYYDNLNLGEKTALNDLIYNVGWNKFKNSKRLQSHLRTGNDAGAKKEMNHGEHQARGLKIRRNQNRQMYDSTFSWKYKKGGVAKYQPGGKTYTGSTSTNYYGDVVHHLPVWNKDGETNVGLPEVVVTPRNNLNLGEAVNRGRNAAGNVGKEILSAVTPLGDIESAKGIYNDATSGNYGSAALGLGLLALPNFIEKPLKAFKRVGSKVIRDFTNSRKLGIVSPQFKQSSKFKSELDWSPKSWFEEAGNWKDYTQNDIDALNSHIPEYLKIEETAKANGTWLNLPNGGKWKGDPRTWVQLMSKDGQGLMMPHKDWKVGVKPWDLDKSTVYNGRSWMSDNSEVYNSFANKKGYAYYDPTLGEGRTFALTIPKSSNVAKIDAKGNDYAQIPYGSTTADSDQLINWKRQGGYDATLIENVVEGPHVRQKTASNDFVIHEGTPRKSIVGNNGNFNLNDKNIYRGLIPLGIIGGMSYGNKRNE